MASSQVPRDNRCHSNFGPPAFCVPIGPKSLALMPLAPLDKEPTLENIKEACKSHFNINTEMECDILAGERGPSFSDAKQIQNWKVLHIRFIEGSPAYMISEKRESRSEPVKESPKKSCRRVLPTS